MRACLWCGNSSGEMISEGGQVEQSFTWKAGFDHVDALQNFTVVKATASIAVPCHSALRNGVLVTLGVAYR